MCTSTCQHAKSHLVERQCLHVNVVCFTLRARVGDEDSDRLLTGVRVAASLHQEHCQAAVVEELAAGQQEQGS